MPRNSLSTLERLNAQIAELQKKADALKDRERTDVIARIQSAMDHYGISAAELRSTSGVHGGRKTIAKTAMAKSKRTQRKKKGVIRFRDSQGNTWTGVGKRPNWYKAAIASGKTPEDLAAN